MIVVYVWVVTLRNGDNVVTEVDFWGLSFCRGWKVLFCD